jgi:hypothetical protein
MLLAVDRPRAKEILSERQTLGSELRSRAGGVSDVAGFTRWNDDVREWEHATAHLLESLFTTRQAAAALESERVKRVSLVSETHAERFDRRQEDLRRELAFVTALRDRLYAIEEAPPNFRRNVGAGQPRVLLVHGVDGARQTVVASLLEQTRSGNNEIVVLDDLPAVLDVASTADYGVVVATGDPDLIFAMGYLVGKLGADRVTVLHQRGTELPRHPGVNYAELDAGGNWRAGLLQGLKRAGLPFDLKRLT